MEVNGCGWMRMDLMDVDECQRMWVDADGCE